MAMLILFRKKNEGVVINNDIIVTVAEIQEDRVRIEIVSPQGVAIHRQEVFEAVQGKADAGSLLVSPKGESIPSPSDNGSAFDGGVAHWRLRADHFLAVLPTVLL